MNLEEKRTRLKNLLEDNISVGNVGTAIAITGSWGVGKTFFWNSFRDEVNFKKKYVYVSLFGLESLSDLKTHIYSNIENNHSALEIPRWIRGLPSILKDTRVSQFGVSASAKVFDSLMFNQVKDAIICFDDFERMSNKLDIKDVMGLANQLKLEKNCQVILILDEDKAEGENKKKYAEYKEKLIDETIIINSVEPLIRANTQDMDEPLIELMVKFADELGVHNFRFFQKVIKLYKQFREQLPETVADSTKEIILVRILQGYFIEEFGISYEFDWEDIKIIIKDKQKDWSGQKVKTYESLFSINSYFLRSDEWLNEFKKWFNQVGTLDFELLNQLANSTLISEENNKHKDNFHQGCEDFWGLKVDKKFPDNFYEKTRLVIGLENLSNLSFALKILEIFNIDVTTLEQEIIDWLKGKIEKDISGFRLYDSFGEVRPIFKKFVETYELDKEKLPNLIDAIFNIHVRQEWSNKDELSVQKASKEDWEKILFDEIPQDSRFDSINSSYIVKKVLEREKGSDLGEQIRNVITEIYNEKGQTDEFYKSYMDFLITRLDN
ncbi:P-loop NTPase fold protein [Acinetobacter sp. ANC 4178]|uniref:P-loop NTPase fold protein n=1 Tax=Acinetobacter sp. ANC 4178 TaxID=2529839 RepID=UPI00103B3519|nr:P-loop NTPase fold protein [Acinetobacter sp. ANC 4178]TCB65548.1 KAP family P-loop domain protein [Acinetobacter sp. ANC 4178]